MGQAHSYSTTTLADQSDTLTLGFLPPSPHESTGTLSTLAHTASPNESTGTLSALAHTTKGDEEMRKKKGSVRFAGGGGGPSTAGAAPSSSPNAAGSALLPSTPTSSAATPKPRFLGMFRRVHIPHPHKPHIPHIPHPNLHVPHIGKSHKPPTKSVDTRPTALDRRGPKPRLLLDGCSTPEEHYDRIDHVLDKTRGLKGRRGLEAAGFEYRLVKCPKHAAGDDNGDDDEKEMEEQADDSGPPQCPTCVTRLHIHPWDVDNNASSSSSSGQDKPTVITLTNRPRHIADGTMYEEIARLCQEYAQERMAQEGNLEWVTVCSDENLGEKIRCMVPRGHRLCGRDDDEDDEDEDEDDGSKMESEGGVTPVSNSSPILLITTGKGKVRAGIFSRQHLMTTALEPATALPIVREAKRRGMRCVIPDPNARGDRNGMETYRRSMSRIFEEVDSGDGGDETIGTPATANNTSEKSSCVGNTSTTSCSCEGVPIYVLAHSASGGHFVRYLRDHSPSQPQSQDNDDVSISPALINRIRAVAFTDSTHNIQWTRKDSAHKDLESMLEGEASLYVRVEPEGSGLAAAPSTSSRRSLKKSKSQLSQEEEEATSVHHVVKPKETAGKPADTDHYWRHRFGSVKTVWAGTGDHSLTNWAAHSSIWEHFDRHRKKADEAS